MRASSTLSWFVTGTDTEIGKTLASAALLHGFARHGLRATAMKPIAAGAEEREGVLHNEDADHLDAAANMALPSAIRTPFIMKTSAAPHIVTARKGVKLKINIILASHAKGCEAAEVVVEGPGGFRVPLSTTGSTRTDLAWR